MPIILTIIWATVLKDVTYTDWFHLAKVYSATAGCIRFWLIRHLKKKDKLTGEVKWRLADNKVALCFPPLILAINIAEAVARDIEVGMQYWLTNSGAIEGEVVGVMGGPWNYMNAAAGILNIITITGWFGIPTLCAFTVGKGAWLQHRAQTLAIWCMFAQTFPSFQDKGVFVVKSTYNTTIYNLWGALAFATNVVVIIYMIYKIAKTKRNPYKGELYIDNIGYKKVKALAE